MTDYWPEQDSNHYLNMFWETYCSHLVSMFAYNSDSGFLHTAAPWSQVPLILTFSETLHGCYAQYLLGNKSSPWHAHMYNTQLIYISHRFGIDRLSLITTGTVFCNQRLPHLSDSGHIEIWQCKVFVEIFYKKLVKWPNIISKRNTCILSYIHRGCISMWIAKR